MLNARARFTATFAVAVFICAGLTLARAAGVSDLFVYFGTQRSGTNVGFSLGHFDTDTGTLTKPKFLQEAKAPAFFTLRPDGQRLYTVNATSPGEISAYEIAPHTGQLTLLNRASSGGDGPCYVSLDQTAQHAFVANYASGNLAAYALKPDGSLGERTALVQHTGHSVNPNRQTHAYAHSVIVDPSNRFVLVTDLGVDKVFVYRFNASDGSLTPNDPPFAAVAPGSGPRHVKFHPNGKWAYVINEMASTVCAFDWNATNGALTERQSMSALPEDFKGANTCGEVEVHPNGKFLYASNRGHDSLAVFAIDEKTGRLTLVERVACGGKTPRFFNFDPTGKWLLCSNHGSDNTVVFRVNGATGRLTQAGPPVAIPYPFCQQFLPVR